MSAGHTFPFLNAGRPPAPSTPPMPPIRLRITLSLSRTFTSTSTRQRPELPFPIIPNCPPSSCTCAPTPPLETDRARPLSNTVPPYTSHIVIPTGRHNWPSRIEDSPPTHAWGALAAHLKRELGPRGGGFDRENPVLITTSSFSPGFSTASSPNPDTDRLGSILLFPASRQHHVLAPCPSPATLRRLLRPTLSNLAFIPIKTPTILVCSHASRDSRCGTLGPLLLSEFQTQLFNLGLAANTTCPSSDAHSVNLAGISHVGGHAWAGNVIIYTPLEAENALAGTGIWLGRVEPRHVDGIIKETILGGRVIGELLRGGIGSNGRVMRI